jgi:comEA protein
MTPLFYKKAGITLKDFTTSNKLLLFCTLAFVLHIALSTGFSSRARFVSHITDKEPLLIISASDTPMSDNFDEDLFKDAVQNDGDAAMVAAASTPQTSEDAKPQAVSYTATSEASNGKAAAGTKININTAGRYELERLPGVGEATALKIIDFRSKNGAFKRIEDIMLVSGIGEKKFANMKELLTIE